MYIVNTNKEVLAILRNGNGRVSIKRGNGYLSCKAEWQLMPIIDSLQAAPIGTERLVKFCTKNDEESFLIDSIWWRYWSDHVTINYALA